MCIETYCVNSTVVYSSKVIQSRCGNKLKDTLGFFLINMYIYASFCNVYLPLTWVEDIVSSLIFNILILRQKDIILFKERGLGEREGDEKEGGERAVHKPVRVQCLGAH